LPATDAPDAWKLAECIRQAIEQAPLDHHGDQIQITVSIGLTSGSLASDDIEALIQRADKYLYRAKNEGRNRSFTTPEQSPDIAAADSAVG
jgi:diguanylate cyclase (GGDEF)-like protein